MFIQDGRFVYGVVYTAHTALACVYGASYYRIHNRFTLSLNFLSPSIFFSVVQCPVSTVCINPGNSPIPHEIFLTLN